MRKYLVFLIFLVGLVPGALGLPIKKMYPANEIPEELKEDAVAVIRDHEEIFYIESFNRAARTVRHVVTILEEDGDDYAVFNEWYDKLRSIGEIQIVIYDKHGDVLKRVRAHEIEDYCSFSSFSIYEDNRQKLYVPVVKDYPYTVSCEFEMTYKGLFVYPTWQPLEGYEISVEKSSFRIEAPRELKLRFKNSNLGVEPVLNYPTGKADYYWEVRSLKAVESEDYSPYLYRSTGILYTAPSDFSIDGFRGNMDSWENLGRWAYDLLKRRGGLTDKTKSELAALIEGIDDKREIVEKVYKYMQSRTRYVSIQEGIGGWQPFPALQVDEDGYGDCKALSNYTMTLLKEVGIESFYTKVRAGKGIPDINTDFVSNQSNHIILCVPLENDTVWLECTSQISPFGYIGNFTDDRHVLVVTPEGGKLVKTRTYTGEENLKAHRAEVILSDNGISRITIESTYRGTRYDNVSALLSYSADDRGKWVYNNTSIENTKILGYEINQDKEEDVVPVINTRLELEARDFGSTTGDRWFIPLNLVTRIGSNNIPSRNRDRRTEIVYRSSFTDIDSVRFTIPEGYEIESVPQGSDINNEFGSYSLTVNIEDNKILFVRKRTMNKGSYPASMYTEFRQFFTDMVKMDNCKVVLKRFG